MPGCEGSELMPAEDRNDGSQITPGFLKQVLCRGNALCRSAGPGGINCIEFDVASHMSQVQRLYP